MLKKKSLSVYWGKGRLQLERKASQDRHFANELEAPKPNGRWEEMHPNMGQRKEPSSSPWQKYSAISQPAHPQPKEALI